MKRISLTLIGLIFFFSFDVVAKKGGNGNGGNNNTYITNSNFQGDFEDSNAWDNNNIPSDFENINKEMTINGTISRNGNLNPVTVTVNGILNVSGNYSNNQWGGLTIEDGATVEIFGNLEGSAGISVKKGGILIVHGNLSSTGSSFKTNGDVIVKGDFSTSSSTQVQNKGNLVVGGDFSHLGGGLNAKSDDIYILDPEANITSPGWGIIENGDYGNLDDFVINEEGSVLEEIVENVGLVPAFFTWVGGTDNDWFNQTNWKNQEIPGIESSVKIESGVVSPVIDGDVLISSLSIAEGSSLVLNVGSTLEITEDVQNDGLFVLESEFDNLSSLLLPDNASKPGKANVKMLLQEDRYWYMSAPLKNAEAGWFKPSENADKDYVYVFEVVNNRWQWVRLSQEDVNNQRGIDPLQGVVAYYYDNAKQLDFTGEVNNDEIVKEFNDPGYHLLGNPYPTAIDWSWDNADGWEREGFSNTIWSWVSIGNERVVQTYNGEFDIVTPQVEGYNSENKGHIPAYQSVWIKQTTEKATLTVKKSARVKDNSAPLKSTSAESNDLEMIRIRTQNEYALDETVLFFSEGLSSNVGEEDGEKRFNGSKNVPEVYTKVGNTDLSINGLPALSEQNYEIPVSVRNRVEGNVTLSFDLSDFANPTYDLFLQDTESGAWINLREVSEYVYTPDQMGDDHDRFVLHLEKVKQVATSVENTNISEKEDITIIGQQDYALIKISRGLLQSSEAVIEVLDMTGRLMRSINTGSTEAEVELPCNSGVYVVKVNVGGIVKTEKVVMKAGR
ncbi:T9SS type A sorting domain-containing protein [Marinilabilia rubra]|uniref:Secretion system C-terminal sorting domain-containing protein n=1 Tax=Marinilabilia rubra TaxID=2162893 RepID=A0A2U2B9Q1_9BACT|nr:T9SS type A sorting domain-containing protein [Marinilabilia rubra]PWD99772.1 hypothetical protein DDZ16_07705 [Marinilabilia rubra]